MVALDQNHLENNPSTQVHINMDNMKAKIGGWLTLPFIIGSIVGLSLAAGSWYANLTMFLIREYNVRESLAVQIYEITNIGLNILPIVGALFSDSFFGSFFVINVASIASLLGVVMLGLSTIIPSLRPHPCNNMNFSIINTTCDTPSINQYAFLFVALSLATLGFGCTRFLLSSLGAYQFDKPEHRRIFFNVYILAYEACTSISYGVIVLVVQEQGKWAIGFGIGIAANIIGIIFFLLGSQYYRHIISQPNPFVCVVHALKSVTISKIKLALTKDNRVHNDEQISSLNIRSSPNKASRHDSIYNKDMVISTKSWTQTLITSIKQAEDLKKIIRIMPVWSAGIILSTVVTTSSSLVASQASSMDLTISRRIKLPAEFMTVFGLIATCVTLSIFDCFLFPLSRKITGQPLKPLQRGGVGHVFVVLGMIALAVVEMARLNSIKTSNLTGHTHGVNYINKGPIMSAYWLIMPMVLLGIGAAYYYPGGITFSYQEFPKSLKSSSTAMSSIQVIIGFYLSKAFIKFVKRHSSWLTDDINRSRLDIVYWVLALSVAVNFGYYLICTTLYKYNVQDDIDGDSTISTNVDKL